MKSSFMKNHEYWLYKPLYTYDSLYMKTRFMINQENTIYEWTWKLALWRITKTDFMNIFFVNKFISSLYEHFVFVAKRRGRVT